MAAYAAVVVACKQIAGDTRSLKVKSCAGNAGFIDKGFRRRRCDDDGYSGGFGDSTHGCDATTRAAHRLNWDEADAYTTEVLFNPHD